MTSPAHVGSLNAICPYFTMFPLAFPRKILEAYARKGQRVLDPFCGRGTTNFAARLAGLDTVGVDSNPVAAAITSAKLATTTPDAVVRAARRILDEAARVKIPPGEFWSLAYRPEILRSLCRLREALLADCSSQARRVLRAIVLGALHGPRAKGSATYFSNQCTRTYAPKPGYAARFWKHRKLLPPQLDVLELIRTRAERYLRERLPAVDGIALLDDSRNPRRLQAISGERAFDWIITSPPYYGMRTYVQDQWLRYWFMGGPHRVDYTVDGQLNHMSPETFAAQLKQVWDNAALVSSKNARLVVRFGGIRDRKADPLELIRESFRQSAWHLQHVHKAGSAASGKRQADAFLKMKTKPMTEYDCWACLH
jgi:hypothetical protein